MGDPVLDIIEEATANAAVSANDAIDSVTQARSELTQEDVPQKSEPVLTAPVQGEPARKKNPTKAELTAEVDRMASELQRLQERNRVLEAMTSQKAINDLGATMALAIKIAGQFMAAKRGDHWIFPDTEAKGLGEAWSAVAAPYAEQLKTAVPWALAVGLTWQSIASRLEKDGAIVIAETETDGTT